MKKNEEEDWEKKPREYVQPENFYEDEVWICSALLEKDFITTIEKWWKDTFKPSALSLRLTRMKLDGYLPDDDIKSIVYLKEFIEKKEPELFGRALLWNPRLLEHPDIRAQLINWLNGARFTILTGDKRCRAPIESFAKSLIPRAGKISRKKWDLALLDGGDGRFKASYYDFYEAITKEFENYKKKVNKGKLNEAEISKILKKLFQSLKNENGEIFGTKFNRYFTELAKLKQPAKIARKILRDILKRDADFEVGHDILKKFVSPTKS